MPKRILIPTDFSINSLNILKEFLQKDESDEQYDVVLSCGYYLSESITDLLFFSKHKILRSLNTDAFMDAISILRNKYAHSLHTVNVDLFTGSVQSSFDDYLEGNKIETIVFGADRKFTKTVKRSFDLSSFVQKAKVNKIMLTYKLREDRAIATDDLTVIFNTAGSFS
ncbi:MAG: hypothetical protein BGO31_18065 [Bacteroidetes bacterium 43-16]|nr:MAG: hypothetical protein BGO31_18065 [Bacteroidetes bacterium 43-16]